MSNTTTTLARSPMPDTAADALAHLVTRHGWAPGQIDPELVQAHRFAHGIDGRPDLADDQLDHAHSAPASRPPTAPPKKNHNKAVWWTIGLGALFLLGFAAVAGAEGGRGIGGVVGVSTHTVTYKVEGTTSQASITYEDSAGDTSQQSDVDVPLRMSSDHSEGITLSGMHNGAFLYISAQNSQESGSVTCAIEVDGVRVKENTSRGGYTIATCSGRL